jgi:hypothetical protein
MQAIKNLSPLNCAWYKTEQVLVFAAIRILSQALKFLLP